MFLKDLQYFSTVGRLLNIARAAETLGVSQPTVSKAVARLERQMRVRLLERMPRGVRLSPAGTAFLRYANGASHLLRDAAGEMREFRHAEAGVVRLGVGLAIPESLVDDAIEAVSKLLPAVRFELRGGMADSLLDSLEAGLIDLVLTGVGPQPRKGVRWQPLLTDALVFTAPGKHALLRAREAGLDDIAKSRLILPAPGTVTRAWFDALYSAEGKQPPLPFIESHASGRELPMALRFNCVVLLPLSVLETPAIAGKLLQIRVPPQWDMARPISLAMRVGRLGEHAQLMAQAIVEQARAVNPD